MITDWHFYAVAAPAVLLLGLGKGGFSGVAVLSMPLMSLVLPPIQAAAFILPILMVQDIVGVWAFRRDYSAKNLKYLFPGGLFGLFLGWAFARTVSDGAILLIVGLISTVFVLYQLARRQAEARPPEPPRLAKAGLWSVVCGFTSFIANAGGPPFQVYMLPQKLPPRVYAGTSTIFFAVFNYLKFPAFIQLGAVSPGALATSAALFPLAIAAVAGGVWLVRRVDAASFYKLVYGLTFCVGLKLMWDGARRLGAF
ncbi:MAG TPA: sulfite exporter TauE/SafE family protein [Beijerinckiaceae bacterium]|jgi:uncharacterized membrane protein YfcA